MIRFLVVITVLAVAAVPVSFLLIQPGPPPAEAVFVTSSAMSDFREHRLLAKDLTQGVLDRTPNSNGMRRNHIAPMPQIVTRGKGLVLRATTARDQNTTRFDFQVLYLSRDPGMTPTKIVFKNGKPLGTKTTLVIGTTDMETGRITYGYPVSGYIRIRPAGPNDIEVEYHVKYGCVTGSGAPGSWKAEPDCPQKLFPQSIIYVEKAAGAV